VAGRAEARFEASQALLEGRGRGLDLGPRDLDESELELQARIEAVLDVALRLAEGLDHPDELARMHLPRLRQKPPRELVVEFDCLAEHAQRGVVVGGLFEVLQQEDLAQVTDQVTDELRVVDAFVGEALHEAQRLARLPIHADVGDLEEEVGLGDAKGLEDIARADDALAVRGELLQCSDGVAEAAL